MLFVSAVCMCMFVCECVSAVLLHCSTHAGTLLQCVVCSYFQVLLSG